ncbi:hypothetical protein I4F81_011953 [Pyropia yezoensis]|uniref:Uncharacterized protein n=1 Tax=Pyropia yezoensis TaxID=2788 RepID=A0ACC3CH20_PYRYE|nr:hypothetical protein I4F81_011953 [Neopyropia yezoensis]
MRVSVRAIQRGGLRVKATLVSMSWGLTGDGGKAPNGAVVPAHYPYGVDVALHLDAADGWQVEPRDPAPGATHCPGVTEVVGKKGTYVESTRSAQGRATAAVSAKDGPSVNAHRRQRAATTGRATTDFTATVAKAAWAWHQAVVPPCGATLEMRLTTWADGSLWELGDAAATERGLPTGLEGRSGTLRGPVGAVKWRLFPPEGLGGNVFFVFDA